MVLGYLNADEFIYNNVQPISVQSTLFLETAVNVTLSCVNEQLEIGGIGMSGYGLAALTPDIFIDTWVFSPSENLTGIDKEIYNFTISVIDNCIDNISDVSIASLVVDADRFEYFSFHSKFLCVCLFFGKG